MIMRRAIVAKKHMSQVKGLSFCIKLCSRGSENWPRFHFISLEFSVIKCNYFSYK